MPIQNLIRRILLAFPTLFGIALATFALVELMPGDPAIIALGLDPDGFSSVDPQEVERVRHELGLDRPFTTRFADWLGGFVTGDLGYSLVNPSISVGSLIVQAIPTTVVLILGSMSIAIFLGVPLGAAAAFFRGSAYDAVIRISAILGMSMPAFWFAMILALFFAYYLDWFPLGGELRDFGLKAAVLPVCAMALQPMSLLIRITRASLIEVLSQDYIRTAVSKGLPRLSIVVRHGLPNAAIPIITVIGVQIGGIVGATVAIENVFLMKGLGTLLVQSIVEKDIFIIQASILSIATLFIVVNILIDVSYFLVDPRIEGN